METTTTENIAKEAAIAARRRACSDSKYSDPYTLAALKLQEDENRERDAKRLAEWMNDPRFQ